MEWSLSLRLEERVELLEERFEMGEIIIEQVGIFVSIVLGEQLVQLE